MDTPTEPTELEVSLETLSDAFGFAVPPSVVGLTRAALRLRPEEPHLALEPLGLVLGGPLYPFLGGHPLSLRVLETPPELFPFAHVLHGEAHFGLVVDDPDGLANAECAVAGLDPRSSEGCRLRAATLPAFLAAQAARALRELPPGADPQEHRSTVEDLVAVLATEMTLDWPADPEALAIEGSAARERVLSYRTEDGLGVVVPEEPAPLELIALDSRRHLIGARDRERVLDCGRRAQRVGAAGAALALARDLVWHLGHRPEWYRIAIDLMEESYPTLKRPLLARVSRREWARFFRQTRG